MHQSTTPSLSQTIWPRWVSRQFLSLPIVHTLFPVTFGYSLSSEAVVIRQLRRWKRLWRRSLTLSHKRTSMGPSRSCWNGITSALLPEEITSKGTRVLCVYNQQKCPYEKKSGNLFNDPRNMNDKLEHYVHRNVLKYYGMILVYTKKMSAEAKGFHEYPQQDIQRQNPIKTIFIIKARKKNCPNYSLFPEKKNILSMIIRNKKKLKFLIQRLKLVDRRRGRTEGSFPIAITRRCGCGCSSFPWISSLNLDSYLIMLSKEASSTVFWVFNMITTWNWTRSPELIANTIAIIPMWRYIYIYMCV